MCKVTLYWNNSQVEMQIFGTREEAEAWIDELEPYCAQQGVFLDRKTFTEIKED